MKRKKLLRKTTALLLSLSLLCSSAYTVMANDAIKVTIDDQQIAFDVPPQLINDRTMVPLRAIFEALNATVDWNDETQTVTSTKDGTTIQLTINNPTMYVNGTPITLDSPACLINDRTLVPVRAISEAFKTNVDWDNDTKTVIIKSNVENKEDAVSINYSAPKSYYTLKRYLLSKGDYTENGLYASTAIKQSGTTTFMAYNPSNNNITFSFGRTVDNGDQMHVLLVISENVVPGVILNMKFSYGLDKDILIGQYASSDMTILESAIPSSNDSYVELINSVYGLFDSFLKIQGIDVTISDFGINY